MNKRIKKKWLKALRSGEYKQGRTCLRSVEKPDHFCCLGILCNIFLDEQGKKWSKNKTIASNREVFVTLEETWNYQTLPKNVVKWAKLEDENPNIKLDNGIPGNLASFNDDETSSFEKIAQLIEDQL